MTLNNTSKHSNTHLHKISPSRHSFIKLPLPIVSFCFRTPYRRKKSSAFFPHLYHSSWMIFSVCAQQTVYFTSFCIFSYFSFSPLDFLQGTLPTCGKRCEMLEMKTPFQSVAFFTSLWANVFIGARKVLGKSSQKWFNKGREWISSWEFLTTRKFGFPLYIVFSFRQHFRYLFICWNLVR